jgi:hypothetical protein
MLRQTVAVLLVAAALAMPRNAGAFEPKDFGFGLNKAEGTRPLLVVWVRQPDDAARALGGARRGFDGAIGLPAETPGSSPGGRRVANAYAARPKTSASSVDELTP